MEKFQERGLEYSSVATDIQQKKQIELHLLNEIGAILPNKSPTNRSSSCFIRTSAVNSLQASGVKNVGTVDCLACPIPEFHQS